MDIRKLLAVVMSGAPPYPVADIFANYTSSAWIDASDPTVVFKDAAKTQLAVANDDKIYTIADKSGNGYDVTQPTEALRYSLQLNQANGKQSARAATTQFMTFGNPAGLQLLDNCTILVVYRTTSVSRQTLFGQDASNAIKLEILTAANKRDVMVELIYHAEADVNNGQSFECYVFRRSAFGHQTIRINGSTQTLIINTSDAYDATNPFITNGEKFIGQRKANSQFFIGDFEEMIIVGDSLPWTELAALEHYLCAKYAITYAPSVLPTNNEDRLTGNAFSIQHTSDPHFSPPPGIPSTLYNSASVKLRAMMLTGDYEGVPYPVGWATYLTTLEALNVPFLITDGNHDWVTIWDKTSGRSANWTTTFPTTILSDRVWWNGAFKDAGHIENAYTLATIGGIDFLFIVIEWAPPAAVITWAQGIIEDNPTATVILGTHAYLQDNNTYLVKGELYASAGAPNQYDGQEIFDALVKPYANVSWVLSGHDLSGNSAAFLQSTGDNNNIVNQSQVHLAGGTFKARIITVYPETNRAHVQTIGMDLTYMTGADFDYWVDFR